MTIDVYEHWSWWRYLIMCWCTDGDSSVTRCGGAVVTLFRCDWRLVQSGGGDVCWCGGGARGGAVSAGSLVKTS